MNKHFGKLLILGIAGVFLSACSLTNSGAWKSSGTQKPVTPTVAPTAVPTQTVEELGTETDKVLGDQMDSDFKSIDADLKQIDEELKAY